MKFFKNYLTNKIFKQLTKPNFLENLVLFLYMINKNLLEY